LHFTGVTKPDSSAPPHHGGASLKGGRHSARAASLFRQLFRAFTDVRSQIDKENIFP
jgi:hypothetical protein